MPLHRALFSWTRGYLSNSLRTLTISAVGSVTFRFPVNLIRGEYAYREFLSATEKPRE